MVSGGLVLGCRCLDGVGEVLCSFCRFTPGESVLCECEGGEKGQCKQNEVGVDNKLLRQCGSN